MTTAAKLIEKSLRLINVPGNGGVLQQSQKADAFDTLKDLIASFSTDNNFIPGTTQHHFQLQAGTNIYTYGPGGTFNTLSSFDNPNTPIKIMSAFIREGGQIVRNQKVSSVRFEDETDWTIDGSGWEISDGEAQSSTSNSNLTQEIDLVAGTTYVFSYDHATDGTGVRANIYETGNVSNSLYRVLLTTGESRVRQEITPAVSGSFTIDFDTESTSRDTKLSYVSLIEKNKQFTELSARGNDRPLRQVGRRVYGSLPDKYSGYLHSYTFNQGYPLSTIELLGSTSSANIFVADVMINSIDLITIDDDIPATPQMLKFLRYQLAYELGPEFGGKTLSRNQMMIKDDAYEQMSVGSNGARTLRVDSGLLYGKNTTNNRGLF